MDPREPVSHLIGDADCAACGRPVPRDRVRILASRDDLAFAELPCEPCGSIGLAIFVAGHEPARDGAGDRSRRDGPPLGPDDVLEMHRFLAGWTGDLRSLVGPVDRSGGGAGAA